MLSAMTDKELARLWRRAWDRMTRGDGYQPYGYDWPTVRAAYPGWHRVLWPIFCEATARRSIRKGSAT